jgi:hypothetical protein
MISSRLSLDKRYGKPQESKEIIRMEYLLWVWRWNKDRRNKTLTLLQSAKDKKVVIVKNAKELDIINLLK